MPTPDEEGEASVEAACDHEISARVKDIEEGKVELISGEEFDRYVDQPFAQQGLVASQIKDARDATADRTSASRTRTCPKSLI